MVVQPTEEAYALALELQGQLVATIALALLGTVVLGWIWARSFITRIFALTTATRALAAGRMDERVAIGGRDEIHQLGESFNAMADRLVELQEDVRKQERQAMFGRIAAGLVHDLSHPIQNIGNSCKLIVKMFDDLEYRETFRRTVEREMVMIKRVLDDLRNIARPIPLERFPVEINRSVTEVVESMQQHADTAGVMLRADLAAEPAFIDADVFALGRVYRNLILNAIQATAPGGLIVVESEAAGDRVMSACATPAAASRPIACRRSSRTSSRPSAGASASALPSPARSSNSSAVRSQWRAKWARAPPSRSSFHGRAPGRCWWRAEAHDGRALPSPAQQRRAFERRTTHVSETRQSHGDRDRRPSVCRAVLRTEDGAREPALQL